MAKIFLLNLFVLTLWRKLHRGNKAVPRNGYVTTLGLIPPRLFGSPGRLAVRVKRVLPPLAPRLQKIEDRVDDLAQRNRSRAAQPTAGGHMRRNDRPLFIAQIA